MNQDVPCQTCEGRPPQLNDDNIRFLRIWNLVSNSFFYVSTMESVVPTGMNWTNVESILRLSRIKASRMLIRRIMVAERLTIERANEANEVKRNDK